MTRSLRLVFLFVAALCTASALGFALLRYALEPSDEFAAYNHPAEPWCLDVHVASSVALTLVLGYLLGVHVVPSLAQERRARASGIAVLAATAAMVASGALLPCASGEVARLALVWAHGVSGALFALLLPWHLVRVRRARRRLAAEASRGVRAPRAPRTRPRAFAGAR